MSYGTPQHLRPGGDPRALPDYTQLRDELSKLTHPARPDVDWQQVESLSLSLFSQNGVELQTAAWYTLARTQLAGLHGLCEGLAVLEVLLAHQWGSFWPQPVHARMEILTSLSQRLQQVMRTLVFTYSDLGKLYQAEQHLSGMGAVLQRLELKHISQLDSLQGQIHNAAIRLEKSSSTGKDEAFPGIALPDTVTKNTPARITPATTQWVFVAQPEPTENITVVKTPSPQPRPWKAFIAGAVVMLVAGSTAVWGWQVFNHQDLQTVQLEASLVPLPEVLSEQQLMALKQKNDLPVDLIPRTQQQLTRLAHLSPVWALQYGNQLVRQAQALFPTQSQQLARQWQQQLNAAALPPESLNGWSQGMTQLQQLADRLNTLDGQRGKYITVSELKSQVFSITQAFNRAVPVEEQLRQLAQTPQTQPLPAAQQSQTEMALNALLNRYMLTTLRPPQNSVSP
ncbi:ImpA domain protein [compost metagenome]